MGNAFRRPTFILLPDLRSRSVFSSTNDPPLLPSDSKFSHRLRRFSKLHERDLEQCLYGKIIDLFIVHGVTRERDWIGNVEHRNLISQVGWQLPSKLPGRLAFKEVSVPLVYTWGRTSVVYGIVSPLFKRGK